MSLPLSALGLATLLGSGIELRDIVPVVGAVLLPCAIAIALAFFFGRHEGRRIEARRREAFAGRLRARTASSPIRS